MSKTSRQERGRKRPLDESATVNLKVKGQDGRELFFRIKRNTQLSKLLTAYCDRLQLEYKAMQFFYNGNRFSAKKTPDQLHMEDGDEIDATMHQLGGGYRGV
ncbi:hypothetical protein L1049_016572 [Liquidambar formosana]|uniref:Ubiquitin-like domain-containing protein n=1 Tax=Liquidambar formosana TaxID=63359 RepID=A0AAP0S6L7_LIQFO